MSLYIDKTNKKAVSEVISYVILIVIALALSVLVYMYLAVYVPKDNPKCPEEISLYAKEVSCNVDLVKTNLSLTLENKGLFDIHGVYIRFGPRGNKVLRLVNDPLIAPSIFFSRISSPYDTGLAPQMHQTGAILLPPTDYPVEKYTLEIQPAVFIEKKIVICEKAISRQDVECV